MSLSPEQWTRVKVVFDAATGLDAIERAAFLDRECSGDAALRQQVDTLLESHERAPDFLETPAAVLLGRPATPDNLIGRTIGPYRLVERIGAGGMGEVYKAEDSKLNRPVALKLLPERLATDADRLRRFHAEALAASSLNHPQILVVHDFGDVDGRPFIVTEFVEGRTLRDRMQAGAIPAAEAVDIAIQVAGALAAAHARGLVHRDIKPENVMLRPDGHVKVLDFGLAKLMPGRTASADTPSLHTTPGITLGTPRYMSPEQVRGVNVDERTDVWSLGVMLYEMLSGKPPFDGATPSDVMAAILERQAPLLDQSPAVLDRLVKQTLAKNPAERMPSADELRRALESARTQLSAPRSPRWILAAATAAVLIAITAAGLLWRARAADSVNAAPEATRIVVLPFENVTRHESDDWLSGGLSDSLTFGLRDVPTLILVNRERIAEAYLEAGIRESAALAPDVVRALSQRFGVQQYVHGSYQRIGDQIRVVARLVDAESGEIAAQEGITGRFDSILQIEDRLASRFAAALTARPADVRASGTRSLEAYRAYSQAMGLYAAGKSSEAQTQAARALAIDPGYAEAWALSSKAYSRVSGLPNLAASSLEPARNAAMAAARRALDINPALYDAHVALAFAHRAAGSTAEWRSSAEMAIALNGRAAEAYGLLADSYSSNPGYNCARDRDPALAEQHYRTGNRLDPLVAGPYIGRWINLLAADRPEEGLAVLEQGLTVLPLDRSLLSRKMMALALLDRPIAPALRAAIEPSSAAFLAAVALADVRSADTAAAGWAAFDRIDDLFDRVGDANTDIPQAFFYLTLGKPARAAVRLRHAFVTEPACRQYVEASPVFRPFLTQPAIAAVLHDQ